ncbi:MAG: RNA pseudouridine synthase [Candidatus Methylacidiphilales bacterium]|nr:RNA pseudouridine synthase [Candidatus Methylacidiphilales bacterium]
MLFPILQSGLHWRAVDKPSGVLCHPTKPGGPPTLRDWALEQFPGELNACINRLDRETSGIVLLARTHEGASSLGKQIMRRTVGKSYHALVYGRTPDTAEINAPLARLGDHGPSEIHLKQGVHPDGSPARTRIQRLETRQHPLAGEISQVACFPETGRLHQIRVHLAHLGFPVVGDKIYGPAPEAYLEFIRTGWTPSLEARLHLNRHALHASGIGFTWETERIQIVSALPGDLQAFWDLAR